MNEGNSLISGMNMRMEYGNHQRYHIRHTKLDCKRFYHYSDVRIHVVEVIANFASESGCF
ncbi:hypothetical protein HanHA300_Chr11g0398941 [Helianthus annuus]|nr:hypothetical protein HanHA300_Chr11g0398941 [Helianthus annuus]KAJ0517173.1 hypothetical protein HanHA89_Chr11g0422261 [Helianthus annuus]KAJ0685181.1 hypothetical protein HanLR1_Chr11g0399681 [Helianthus annuus]